MRKPREIVSVCVLNERAMLLATVPKSFFCPPFRRKRKRESMKLRIKKTAQLKYDTKYEHSLTYLWKCTYYSSGKKPPQQNSIAVRCAENVILWKLSCVKYPIVRSYDEHIEWIGISYSVEHMDDNIESVFLSMNEMWNSIPTDISGRDCINNNPVAVARNRQFIGIWFVFRRIDVFSIAIHYYWNVHHSTMFLHS